ncbi:hypothetical protein [Streptomyces sp. NPDC001530]
MSTSRGRWVFPSATGPCDLVSALRGDATGVRRVRQGELSARDVGAHA